MYQNPERSSLHSNGDNMNHEEYEKAYPAREINAEPTNPRYRGLDYWDAHKVRDNVEMTDEIACEVVKHNCVFYVIYKD